MLMFLCMLGDIINTRQEREQEREWGEMCTRACLHLPLCIGLSVYIISVGRSHNLISRLFIKIELLVQKICLVEIYKMVKPDK